MPVIALLALQTAWKPYTLEGFVFLLPTPPVEQKIPGTPPGSRYWLSMHNDRNAIVVTVAPLPKNDQTPPNGVLAAVVGGSIDAKGSKLLAQADATFAGYPAIDFKYRSVQGVFGLSRGVVVGDKLVQIGVTSLSEAAIKAPYDKTVAGMALSGNLVKGGQTVAGPVFSRRKLMESPASTEMPGESKERTAPVNSKPDALVLHTQSANYGNRSYTAAYAEIPEGKGPKEEEVSTALQAVNDDVVRSLKGKALPSVDTKLDGAYAIRTVASLGDNGVAIVISSFHGLRLYTLLAVVPAPWKDHPEPKRFLESFKAGA